MYNCETEYEKEYNIDTRYSRIFWAKADNLPGRGKPGYHGRAIIWWYARRTSTGLVPCTKAKSDVRITESFRFETSYEFNGLGIYESNYSASKLDHATGKWVSTVWGATAQEQAVYGEKRIDKIKGWGKVRAWLKNRTLDQAQGCLPRYEKLTAEYEDVLRSEGERVAAEMETEEFLWQVVQEEEEAD